VYVTEQSRGGGIGTALASALAAEAERAGLYKLLGKLFPENEASRRLVARFGFREVGLHLRHGRLDGVWHDVLLVELLLGEAESATAGEVDLSRSFRGQGHDEDDEGDEQRPNSEESRAPHARLIPPPDRLSG
jgi:hypothetical protein